MTLKNAFENLSTEAKQDAMITALGLIATAAKQDASFNKLEAIRALLAATMTVAGSVSVSNFPSDQKVHDDYQTGEVLADQAGSNGVLTFSFSAAVQMVVGLSVGGSLTARLDPFGGSPAAATGIRLDDGIPVYVPVNATTVRVWAPSGTNVSIYGLRRA